MQTKLFFLVCFFIGMNTFAQKTNTHISQYTTENGLPSNLIRGIQWDDNTGFLWIVTEGGLVRFNGVDFTSYNKEKISPVAPEKSIYVVKDFKKNIFISDGSGKVYKIEKNNPTLSKPSGLNNSFVNYNFIAVSEMFFDIKIGSKPFFLTPIEKIIPLSDTACLLLYNKSIFYFSVSLLQPQIVNIEQNQIANIFKIKNYIYFVNNQKKLFQFDINTFTKKVADISALSNTKNYLNQIFWQNGMDLPILISNNNAYSIELKDNKLVENLVSDKIPIDLNIYAIEYSQRNNLLFIGTESKGIIIISPNFVEPKKRKNLNSKNKNAYFSQILLDNGNVLTNEGDEIGNATLSTKQLPIKGKFSNRISYTNNGKVLWYNSKDLTTGINYFHQYNYETGKDKVFEKIKITTQVAVTNGTTYFANNIGIGVLKDDSIQYQYKYPFNVPNLNTYDFKEISTGILAVAGCSGLLRFNTLSNKLDTIFSIPNACFGSIWKYKDYIFWGSYGYGYFIYKNGILKEMPLDKNKFLMYCHCFVKDSKDFCWITTNRGLFKVKLDEIISNFEDDKKPIYYHYFGKNDGLEMTELNGGCTPCALKIEDETYSFPSMDGLLWVNPKNAQPLMPFGEIFIDEILVDNFNQIPNLKDEYHFASNMQELGFKLGFTAWCKKENIYMDYQLNDTLNWKEIKSENNNILKFNNLPPGNYTLRIRKLNGFSEDKYAYKTIKFSIATPWYKSNWFYFLIAASIFWLFMFFSKLRTRNLKKRQQKLEKQVEEKTVELLHKNDILEKSNNINTRLISIISHDIITPLKFLNVAGKNLIEKKSKMTEELKDETILEITTTSKELQLLSTNILNWIKYQNKNRRLVKENFKVHDTVNQVFGILQSMAKQKGIGLKNGIASNLEINQFLEPLRILIYNLITNAINFSNKGEIVISGEIINNTFLLQVNDNGKGMTQEQIENILADNFIVSSANYDNKKGNGLGYLIIKDLVKMMDAKLFIKSNLNEGSKITIEIPI